MGFEDLLIHTCTIQTKTEDFTGSGDGQIDETWADTYENVACRLVKLSGALPETLRGYDPSAMYILHLKSGQTIANGNRVIDSDSNKHLVEYIAEADDGTTIHHQEAYIRRLE